MTRAALAAAASRVRGHLAGRGEWWWAPVLYALAIAWIHRDLWHQHGQATGLGWDVIDSYGPDRQFQADDLRAAALSSWNPYDRGGYAVVADPQFSRYYPGAWPFVALGAITGPAWWLIQVEMLAHQVIAAAMLHLYLRSRGLARSAAVVAGVTLIASVPLIVHKASLVIVPLVWVPLVWLAVDRLIEAPSVRRGLAVAGACTLVVTAGSPPGWFYAGLLIVVHAVHRAGVHAWRARRELAAYARRLAVPAAVAIAVTGVVAAVVIVPFRELLPLTNRRSGLDFATGGPLEPGETLAGIVAPGRGAIHAYVGLVALALAACGAVLARKRDGRIAITWLVVAAVALACSFGIRWPILPWLVEHVPGFDRLRAPPRYRLVMAWTLAPLVGLGWAALTDAALDRRHRRIAIAIAGGVVALAALVIAVRDAPPAEVAGRSVTATIAIAVIAAAVIAGAIWLPGRWRLALAAVVPLVVVNDPHFFLVPPGAVPPAEPRVPARADEAAIVAELGDVSARWRLYDEFVLCHRVGARLRVRDFRGYPAGDPLDLARYVDVLVKAETAPRILEAFNVRWILHGSHPRDGDGMTHVHHPAIDGHFVARVRNRFEAKHPVTLVAWYGAIQVVPAGGVLDAVLAAEADDGTRRVAVIEPRDAPALGAARPALEAAAAAAPASRAGELVDYEPDRIAVRIDAPAPGVVVLDEVIYPGWEVEVDGVAATPVRANYLLRAVAVGAGSHAIVWTFRPTHHRLLVLGYLLGLAAIVAAWPPWRRVVARIRRYASR